MKKICFPTDFSELSLKALPFAVGMAKKLKGELTLMHVVGHWSGMYPEAGREELLEGVMAKFENLREELEKDLDDSHFRFEALQGDVQDCIESYCENEHIDLLVMSTHGYSGLKRLFMGSVTKSLIHTISCPTIAISPTALDNANASKIGPVLLPVDIDHVSQGAIDVAKNFALKNNTSIDLLYALSDHRGMVGIAGVYGDARIYRSYDAFVQEETRLAQEELEGIKADLQKEHPELEVTITVSQEVDHEAIIKHGEENPHSVIVMQTHVKSDFDSFMLGSTAERVIHGVSVPILMLNKKMIAGKKQSACCS